MEKFGLFDLISKLATDKNALDAVIKTIGAFGKKDDGEKPALKKSVPPPLNGEKKTGGAVKKKYSDAAIMEVLKRHDKISKEIDEKYKKNEGT